MKLKLRPIFKDILLTFVTEAVVLLSFFLVFRLLANHFGPEGVGKYSLIKRVVGLVQPFLFLGLAIGLPRYIATSKSREQVSSYIKIGSLVVTFLMFVFVILINLSKDYFAAFFFGSTDYVKLVLPFSFYMAGLTLHGLVYAFFRGRLLVKALNLLQIINIAIVPIVILVLFKNITIEKLISFTGALTFIVAFIFSLYFTKDLFMRVRVEQFKKSFRELTLYSFPRFPSVFIWNGFLSFGPIFAAHFASLKDVGYLSVSQSLLYAIGAATAPLGMICLPKVSNLVADNGCEAIKENLNILIGAVIQLSTFVAFQAILLSDAIIKHWLGQEFLEAATILRIIFCSIIFYAFYEITRNILDAVKVKPINTINLFISLVVFILMSFNLLFFFRFFSPIISLSIAFTIGVISLGILTYISIRKIFPEKFSKDLNYLLVAFGINLLLGGVAILFKPLIVESIYFLTMFEAALGAIYLLLLWLLKIDWIRNLPKKILEG